MMILKIMMKLKKMNILMKKKKKINVSEQIILMKNQLFQIILMNYLLILMKIKIYCSNILKILVQKLKYFILEELLFQLLPHYLPLLSVDLSISE